MSCELLLPSCFPPSLSPLQFSRASEKLSLTVSHSRLYPLLSIPHSSARIIFSVIPLAQLENLDNLQPHMMTGNLAPSWVHGHQAGWGSPPGLSMCLECLLWLCALGTSLASSEHQPCHQAPVCPTHFISYYSLCAMGGPGEVSDIMES